MFRRIYVAVQQFATGKKRQERKRGETTKKKERCRQNTTREVREKKKNREREKHRVLGLLVGLEAKKKRLEK